MSRVPVLTRRATEADLPVLLRLWGELCEVGERSERAVNPALAGDVEPRLRKLLDAPDAAVIVATHDGEPVGMVVLERGPVAPLSDAVAAHLHHLVVGCGHRHRGVGHALLSAATAFAEESNVEHVFTHVYPSMREANRYFARLGFAPVVVRRVAPVAVLRRRLASTERSAARLDLVRRRALLRSPRVRMQRGLDAIRSESLQEG